MLRDAHIAGKRLDIKAVLTRISRCKNSGFTPRPSSSSLAGPASSTNTTATPPRSIPYQARMRALCAFDFDDLLVETLRLLQRTSRCGRAGWQRFAYLMIDEYQDTKPLSAGSAAPAGAPRNGNLAVVGDDDQSIYGWRGPRQNILEFAENFPRRPGHQARENYRSTGIVLQAANAVIANNQKRHGKTLWTAQPGGELIRRHRLPR